MKKEKCIRDLVAEMCLYWNIRGDHELKTIRHFKAIVGDVRHTFLTGITPEQLMRFFHSIRSRSRGTDESVKRQFEYVKRVFKYAHGAGYIKKNPCLLLRLPKSKRHTIVHLTQDEVGRIEALFLPTQRLRLVRDMFLLQCYTGLAFSDLQNLKPTDVNVINNASYICGHRKKTGVEFFIPLTQKAARIVAAYNFKFSFCINQYNMLLKVISARANISVQVSSHVGRKTFGQHMLDSGIRLEVVSKMLGHSSTGMTEKYYARVGLQRVMGEVAHLAAA